MPATAIVPLRDALVDLLVADGELDGFLNGRKVYAGKAPEKSEFAYLVIGPVVVDAAWGYFQQPGRRHRRRLAVWARTSWTAEEIYTRLVTLLQGQRLTVDGHAMQSGGLEFIAGPVEDVDRKVWAVYADWIVETLEN